MAADPDLERVLRAKYLDWCSARLADRFLRLTPDEIYELAQEAEPEGAPGADAEHGVGTEVSYRSVVERVTEALALRIQLPTYEEWSVAYTEAPEGFDEELLGLWREDA